MRYERRYVQFNNLVFDDVDMLGEVDNSSTTYKVSTTEYTNGHGSYTPFKKPFLYVKESSVTLQIYLRMKKLPCVQRPFYRDFAVEQLSVPGKLWAVQDNQLIWAYAVVTNYNESTVRMINTVQFEADFLLYEGVWHKANPHTTFLQPYDVCTYLDCFDFQSQKSCDCCKTCSDVGDIDIKEEECCCDCVTKDMALCHYLDDLQKVYDQCSGEGFRVIENCVKGNELFADELPGQRMCSVCNGVIAGQLYSNTSIPTEGVTISLHGKMHDPSIEINGNRNWFKGDYDGVLTVYPNGDMVYSDGCCDKDLSPEVWKIPSGMDYGWVINPRNNSVVIDLGECCGVACAYFNVDALTI